MQKLFNLIKHSALGIAVLAISGLLPAGLAVSYADDSCPQPANSNSFHAPTGSDAGTYTYQCSGQFTNQYYTYDPTTSTRTATYDPDYQYNCTTDQWTMIRWDYSPAQTSFYSSRVKASTTPDQATNCPVTAPAASAGSDSTGSSGADGSSGSGISGTGNGSTNGTGTDQNTNVSGTNNNNLTLSNTVGSQATSGNSFVLGNTTAGDAASGDAQSIATIANLLQSSGNAFGPGTATFTANINGDVDGDFMFDPSAILDTGANSTNSTDANNNLTVNQANNTDAAINNTINVGATSGDAKVADNTVGGDATSGDADAIVNLMNLINSTVSAGQSFVGTININGNLNGDILLPQNMLDQLLASTGPNSTNSSSSDANLNATSTNNTNENINNDINSTANSGNAAVSGNTEAGSATTGSAGTNVTLLNLTGSQVVGADDLLVFVNVLGKWVGMIMNAPAGSTAASLGGGITSTGPNSTNSSTDDTNVNANSTTNNNLGINNTVNANAQSGDASVKGNTIGGDATSGDANTAVNVLNIANTNLNLSNWFGVLFINVFGDWTGSFGVNTSAGDPVAPATTDQTATATSASSSGTTGTNFASFVAHATTGSGSGNTAASNTDVTNGSVLGSSTSVAKKVASSTLPTVDTTTHASYVLPAIGISIAAIMLIGERVVAVRKNHKV